MKPDTITPPPWRVAKHAAGFYKVETKDRVICDGFRGELANARLIAAAPDLLEAVRVLTACIGDDMRRARREGREDIKQYTYLVELGKNAIAKATT
jgi:hypothetical protein